MSNQPQSAPSDLPPIDTSKISIEISELDAPDYRFDIEVSKELIKEITTRIKEGGLQYDEQQMGNLIVQVSLDEAMKRLDKDSAWGARLLQESAGKYSLNEAFKFSAVVDTLPDEDFDIESIPIKRNRLQVDDALVDTEVAEQQLQFGAKEPFEGELDYGDEITCDAVCTIEGSDQPMTVAQCTLRVPCESQRFVFAGLHIPEVGNALRKTQTANSLTFDFHIQEQRGNLTLKNCSFVRITPATIQHVLDQYGTPNEALFRTQIKMSLQNNFNRENNNFMMHQLYKFLMDNVNIPISKRIIEKSFKSLCETSSQANEELKQEQLDNFRAQAEKNVKRLTINAWLQRNFHLSLSEEDIDKQAAIIAEERRMRPAQIKEEFLAADKIQALGNMAAERKIFDYLEDKMTFTDMV